MPIEIVLNDGGKWYLVRSENRLLGWATERQLFDQLTGLPIAD